MGIMITFCFIFNTCLMFPGYSQTYLKKGETHLSVQFMNEVYNLSFKKADSLIKVYESKVTDKKLLLTFKTYLAWWRILSGDDVERNIKSCDNLTDELLAILNKDKKYNSNLALNYISVYSLKSRLKNFTSDKFKSLFYFYNSKEHINTLEKVKIRDENILFALGVYYSLYGHIQDKFFINMSFKPGAKKTDKQNAINNLEACTTSKNQIIRTESNYFLMKIYSVLEKNPGLAMSKVDTLIKMYPENCVFWIEKLLLLKTLNRKSEVEAMKNKYLISVSQNNKLSFQQRNHFIDLIKKI